MGAGASSRTRGQGMVEFALVFPLFIATLLLIFDTGRFIAAYTSLASGVQNGARVAMIPTNPDTAIENAVKRAVLFGGSPAIAITRDAGPPRKVTVQAKMDHQLDAAFAGLLDAVFPTTVTISHQVTATEAL